MRKGLLLAVTLIIAVSLVVVGCAGQLTEPAEDTEQPIIPEEQPTNLPKPPRKGGPAPNPIQAEVELEKDSYLSGEDIVINISFRIVGSKTIEVVSFRPAIQVKRPHGYGGPVCSIQMDTEGKLLEPGEVLSYTLTWDQQNDQGEQVDYGHYYLTGGKVQSSQGEMQVGLGGAVHFLILPAEGVIEKTIEVNESKTTNDITCILERVELTDFEAKFYAFNTPPGYNLPQDWPPPVLEWAEAEYSLDGGPVKWAGPSASLSLENGIRRIWDMLDPVPKGTKQITFVITRLGNLEGPWEFYVPLSGD